MMPDAPQARTARIHLLQVGSLSPEVRSTTRERVLALVDRPGHGQPFVTNVTTPRSA